MCEKPDKRIFQEACARANCEPHELMHVGDSLESDVGGANGVGATSVWLNRDHGPGDPHIHPAFEIHSLADLGSILALTDLERWGFVHDDLTRLMSLAPDGCLLAEEGGTPAVVTSLIQYGEEAWIGTVLVHPDCRGRGLGAAIVEAALRRARAAGAPGRRSRAPA